MPVYQSATDAWRTRDATQVGFMKVRNDNGVTVAGRGGGRPDGRGTKGTARTLLPSRAALGSAPPASPRRPGGPRGGGGGGRTPRPPAARTAPSRGRGRTK